MESKDLVMFEVTIGEVAPAEMSSAARVLARGMRDNPIHQAAMGKDPLARMRTLERFFGRLLPLMQQTPICARRGGVIVGVLGLAPPGTCQPPIRHVARIAPAILRAGPARTVQTLRWIQEWKKRDPQERHWHLGPVVVEPELQGLGIGSRMMERFAERMDEAGEEAYLETDKAENVCFYERFGFEIIDEATVLHRPNWFMSRVGRT